MRPLYRRDLLYAHPVEALSWRVFNEIIFHQFYDYEIFFQDISHQHKPIVQFFSLQKDSSSIHLTATARNSAVSPRNSTARPLFQNSLNLTTKTRTHRVAHYDPTIFKPEGRARVFGSG